MRGKRWYIEYYHDENGLLKRARISDQLMRIKDIVERERKALLMVAELNSNLLPFGYPSTIQPSKNIPIKDALDLAMRVKAKTDRKKTAQTYGTPVNALSEYLEGRTAMNLLSFTSKEAFDFLDHLYVSKGVTARTHNNYKNLLKGLWNELIKREYCKVNPWVQVSKLKETEKNRRGMEIYEQKAIIRHLHQNEPGLFVAVLLIYHCFIRPGELRFLQNKDVNLMDGTIRIPGKISKNKQTEVVTIPTTIKGYLADHININDAPGHYLFGKGKFLPSKLPCGMNSMNNRHKEVIETLNLLGKLDNIDGLSIYSWKDTGALDLIQSGLDAYEVMRQMRHKDLNTTQKYLRSLTFVNEKIRDSKLPLTQIIMPPI